MAAQGLRNVFAEPGVAEFLREACHCKLAKRRPLIEIHALEGAAKCLRLFGASIDDYRCSSMFNTYTLARMPATVPGLILLGHMINECGARGVRSFDIGVGRAHYKSFFCREPEPLFDTFFGLHRARAARRDRSSPPSFRATHDQAEVACCGERAVLAPDARTTRGSIGGCTFVSAWIADRTGAIPANDGHAAARAASFSGPAEARQNAHIGEACLEQALRTSAVAALSRPPASTARGASMAKRSSGTASATPASMTTWS